MTDSSSAKAVRELEILIESDSLKATSYNPSDLAQQHLILAAKLLETAGYELAQTEGADHTLTLLELSSQVTEISKTIRNIG